jgi:hypothetical protein
MAATIVARDTALHDNLDQKDALMREIHHRVKNNLQIISSLLSMQQRALTDPASKAAVGDTRQRIAALALIYRTLYQSDDLRYADARIFLTELVGQLVASESGRRPAGHLVGRSRLAGRRPRQAGAPGPVAGRGGDQRPEARRPRRPPAEPDAAGGVEGRSYTCPASGAPRRLRHA